MARTIAERMMTLFEGHGGAHGTHGVPESDPDSAKWTIKSTARTLRQPVTITLWQQHLDGTRPLGVIPIREDGTCLWGSGDIDDYEMNILEVVEAVERMKLPLVPCRSKSGGLHLFLFLANPTPASVVQRYLRDVLASLGRAGSEVFPKQAEVLTQRGDVGNWMVMPYFGSDYDGRIHMQVGVKKTGGEQTVEEFLSTAERMRVDASALRSPRVRRSATEQRVGPADPNIPFSDGPPCLQHITTRGVASGEGQNNVLLMVGVYMKRRHPEAWQEKLEEANRTYMTPPHPADKMNSLIRSLERKEYNYTCRVEPMQSHCNAAVCRMRKFGVGTAGAYPVITGMSKLDTDPPVWFVDVEDRRLEVSTETLLTYPRFIQACADKLSKCFGAMKQADWLAALGAAMNDVQLIETPPEVGRAGVFKEHLEEFLTNRQRGESREDILRGRPWEDQEAGRHYFQLKDFEKHLVREGVKDMTRGQITTRIRAIGGGPKVLAIKKNCRNCWYVPSDLFEQHEPSDPPPMKGANI